MVLGRRQGFGLLWGWGSGLKGLEFRGQLLRLEVPVLSGSLKGLGRV